MCVASAALVVTTRVAPVRIRPGTEILSVKLESIRSLTYQTGAMTLTAQRANQSVPFAVRISYGDGRAEQRCETSPDMNGLLRGIATIIAIRQLTPKQAMADFPILLGTLKLGDQISNEPIEAFTVLATRNHSSVALLFESTAAETRLAPGIFANLQSGCAALQMK
jgi:hypothetical protein